MSKSGADAPDPVIVGYEYYLSFHLMFALAGIVALRAIRWSDKLIVWTGNVGGNQTITVDNQTLFGGKKDAGQGGISFNADVMFGGATQTRNTYLPLSAGANANYCPSYRDRFSILFRKGSGGAYVGNSGQLDSVAIIATGADSDLTWQPSLRYITAAGASYPDLNPAHIIRDLLLAGDIGLLANEADVDDTSFSAAAQTLYDEGFGLSLLFSGSESVENYITEVCRHINALVYQDQTDGLYHIKLLRDDYDPAEAIGGAEFPILFDESNSKCRSFSRIGTGEQVNRVVVSYYNISKNSNDSVAAYDPALIDEVGGTPVTKQVTYDGITNKVLAEKVAFRDMREQSTPLARVSLEMNRNGSYLRPGSLFKWSNEELGITEMILRVGKISYGTLLNGTIEVDAIEDVFGYGETIYSGDNYDGHVSSDPDPELIDDWWMFETPYYMYIRKTGALTDALGTDGGTLTVVAKKQTYTDRSFYVFHNAYGDWQAAQRVGGFAPAGDIAFDIAKQDYEILVYFDEPQYIEAGYSLLVCTGVPTSPASREHEIMEVISADESDSPAAGTAWRLSVKRGCADTVPLHFAGSGGAKAYVFEKGYGLITADLIDGDTCGVRLYATNNKGTYSTTESPSPTEYTTTMCKRAFLPYPPAGLKVNGEKYPDHVDSSPDSLVFTWQHRNRDTQMGELFDTWETIAALPANHEYEVRLYGSATNNGTLTLARTTLTTAAGITWTDAEQFSDLGYRPARVKIIVTTINNTTSDRSFTSAEHTFTQ